MMKAIFFILCCALLPGFILAQNLTGTWVGHSRMDFVKLVVIHQGDSLIGYTYDEGPGWCQASFAGHYEKGEKLLRGKGIEMLHYSGDHDLGFYKLEYIKREGVEHLDGTVQIKNPPWSLFRYGLPSQIFLRRISNEVDTTESLRLMIEKRNAPPARQPPPVVTDTAKSLDRPGTIKPNPAPLPNIQNEKSQRASKVVQHIYIDVDSVKIALYDNGQVDQDSVTLFFNEAVILDRYMISDKPKEITIAIPKNGNDHSLDLFAHNLGSIPPNTALIIITAGKKRYELRASYDLNTNARILITHRP